MKRIDFSTNRWSFRAALEMNIFGIPLTGGDVCGHFEDSPQELCYRWTQLGAILPLMRNHNADEAAVSRRFEVSHLPSMSDGVAMIPSPVSDSTTMTIKHAQSIRICTYL